MFSPRDLRVSAPAPPGDVPWDVPWCSTIMFSSAGRFHANLCYILMVFLVMFHENHVEDVVCLWNIYGSIWNIVCVYAEHVQTSYTCTFHPCYTGQNGEYIGTLEIKEHHHLYLKC